MKSSLIEIVQEILSDMSSDEVNSISDTEEAEQVASIVRSTYRSIINNRDWAHTKRLISLTPSSDPALPTHMTLQAGVKKLISINYNKVGVGETRKKYETVKWIEPDHFLMQSNQEDSTAANVDVITDPTGIELFIRNDRAPRSYTSFDDTVIVFDSYDSSSEASLQASKVQARGYITPVWVHTDSAIPDLPVEAFPALIEEAKSVCFLTIKQMPNQKAESESIKQQRWLSQNSWRVNPKPFYPSYGRKSAKMVVDPTFKRD
jgi:hypothetical protein